MRNVLLQRVLDILLLSIFKLENRLGALSSPQHMVNRGHTWSRVQSFGSLI